MFFRDFLAALARKQVSYCLVGGVAVNLHGVPRMTYDIDLAPAMSVENLARLEDLLGEMGLRCRLPVRLVDFSDVAYRDGMRDARNLIAVTFTDPRDPLREVDVLVSPPVAASDLVERAVVLDLDGIRVPVASLPDLIELKRRAGRAQDADDVRLLERILAEQDDENDE